MVVILICCVCSARSMRKLQTTLYEVVQSLRRFCLILLQLILMFYGMIGLNGVIKTIGIRIFSVWYLLILIRS